MNILRYSHENGFAIYELYSLQLLAIYKNIL